MSNREKIISLVDQRGTLRNKVDDLEMENWRLSETNVRQDAIIANRDKTINVLTDQLKLTQSLCKAQQEQLDTFNVVSPWRMP